MQWQQNRAQGNGYELPKIRLRARRAWVKGRRDESRPWPLKLALAIL
jgi:hypothetical protein